MSIPALHAKAELVGNSRSLLKRRLLDAKRKLINFYIPFFESPTFDFTNKRLIGDNGYSLQWTNHGLTSIGDVELRKELVTK